MRSSEAPKIFSSTALLEEISNLIAQRNIKSALRACDEAIGSGTEPLDTVNARWTCFMLLGQFEKAWRESDRVLEWRRPVPNSGLPRHLRQIWGGMPLDGQRVLVRCYHGLGDTIQFSRFLPILKKRVADLKVQCQPALAPLLESLIEPGELVLLDEEPEPDFEREIDIMELPYMLRTTISTIPAQVPYLNVSPVLVRKFRKKCDCPGLKVGLVWSSGSWDPARNIALDQLDPLRKLACVTFFCLQRGDSVRPFNHATDFRFHYAESENDTLLDTAALISNLDLIITVDTMVCHLAGALGKPTWLLLPFCADWRWMLNRSDSPWYPTMKIFRQTLACNWEPVVERIKYELNAFQSGSQSECPHKEAIFIGTTAHSPSDENRFTDPSTAEEASRTISLHSGRC